MPEVRLSSLSAHGPDADVVIERFPCVVGRHSSCSWRLHHPSVSRRHCALSLRDGKVCVEDLGSSNGTLLNGESVSEPRPLADGDRLDVARLSFRIHLTGVAAEPGLAASPSAGREVLVVEDDTAMAGALALVLESWGHHVRVASDGPEALRVAKDAPPEVVLLDIGLPGMNGVEVARQLRAEPGLRQARLVAVTGDEGALDVLQSRAQFEQLLVKPVSPRVLREVVGHAANPRKAPSLEENRI
jgi:CheY-like chemotaxis protein